MSFYREVIDAFNNNQVHFLVFGGFAVNFYGYNRYTADLDLWIDPSPSNLQNVGLAIFQLGFEKSDNLNDFLSQKTIMLRIVEGVEKVDLLLKINIPKSFAECSEQAVPSESIFGKVHFIHYDDLIDEKIRSKRPKDLIDVDQLRTLKKD